jgi:hypothetical protein
VLEPLIAAAEKLRNLPPDISDEQLDILQENMTAQFWAGYRVGYQDAKQGNPNIVEMLASRAPQEEEKKDDPPLEVVKK